MHKYMRTRNIKLIPSHTFVCMVKQKNANTPAKCDAFSLSIRFGTTNAANNVSSLFYLLLENFTPKILFTFGPVQENSNPSESLDIAYSQ